MKNVTRLIESLFHNKIFLLITFVALLLANIVIIKALFFSPLATIINNSKYYHLEYHQTHNFTDFFKDIKKLKVTRLESLGKINRITLVVNDNLKPLKVDGIPVAPILFEVDKTSRKGNLRININIDPLKTKNYSQKQLNDMIYINIISIIYSLTHSSQTSSERIKKINEYTANFYKTKSNPFFITNKNH